VRELRARGKAARAVVANTLGLWETLRRDWRKAARFYAQFRVTEKELRQGVPDSGGPNHGHARDDLEIADAAIGFKDTDSI
jgi:hypothetical protein